MNKLAYLFFIVVTTITVCSCSKDDAESEQSKPRCYFEDLRKANGNPEITYTTEYGRQCKQIEYNMQTDTLQYHCEESKLINYIVGPKANTYLAKFLSLLDGELYRIEEYGEPHFNYKISILNNQSGIGDIIDLNFGWTINTENVSVKVQCFH